jgi:hypothetical protein
VLSNPVPEELQKFIARYINSIEQVEILCLLAEDPSKGRTELEILKRIQSNEKSVTNNLRYLGNERLVFTDGAGGYRIGGENPESARLMLGLVSAYRSRPVAIIEAIYNEPRNPIRQFAEAFRLKRGDK